MCYGIFCRMVLFQSRDLKWSDWAAAAFIPWSAHTVEGKVCANHIKSQIFTTSVSSTQIYKSHTLDITWLYFTRCLVESILWGPKAYDITLSHQESNIKSPSISIHIHPPSAFSEEALQAPTECSFCFHTCLTGSILKKIFDHLADQQFASIATWITKMRHKSTNVRKVKVQFPHIHCIIFNAFTIIVIS